MPVSADDHQPSLVVGATGTYCEFDSPFLRVSLVIWGGGAIADIVSGAQRALSAAYRYTAVMEPGNFEGVRHDGG
jgi:hypothetical protein